MFKKIQIILFICLLLILMAFSQVLGLMKIQGESMEPTLKNNDYVLYMKKFYSIKKGDVVIYRNIDINIGNKIIKRVTKIEGEKVFLNGDNQKESTDSDQFGFVDREGIVGKVIYYFK
ncbi:MAG: signal peptidase I [Mycoplasmatales bacterium]